MFSRYKDIILWSGLAIVLVAVVYLSVVPFSSDVRNYQSRQEQIIKDLSVKLANGTYNDDKNVQAISEEIKYSENRFNQLKEQINFKPGNDYQLPANKGDWLITLQSKTKALQKKTEKLAADKNIRIPASVDIPAEIPLDSIPAYFEKLDMMEQLLGYAIESGCEEVIAIGSEGSLGDFMLTSGGRSSRPTDTTANIVPIKIRGNFKAVNKFIYLLTNAPRFLSLEKSLLENVRPEIDKIILTIAVSAAKK